MTRLARALGAALLAALVPCSSAAAQDDAAVDPSLFKALHWRNIGPFRGGRCTAVAGVPEQMFTFYFGSTGGGVWKTTDGGTSWKNVTDKFVKTGSVGAIATAPSDANVVYVGMGEAQVRGVTTSHGDGVYRSNDAGRTWTHLGLEKTRQIAAICVHPRDTETVWVAAQGSPWTPTEDRGVYRSRDGGAHWERVLFVSDRAGACSLSLDPTNPRVLYAGLWEHQRLPWQVVSGGAGSGLHKSTDGGSTWTKLGKGLPDLIGKIGVAVSPARPDRVWTIVEADDGGLFRSDDAGESFQRVNAERVLRARAWYYTRVFADPQDENTVYVANAPLMKSIDGGKTFTRVSTPHGDNHALWINPRNSDWLINGNDGGANVSFNGGDTWSTQGNQPTAQFYRVITDRQFPYRVYGGQQDNSTVSIASRSAGNGIDTDDWHAVGGGESAFVAFDPEAPELIYAGVYQGIITEFDERTRTARNIMAQPFLGLGAQPKDLPYRFNWNAPIVASPHDPRTIYHAGNRLLRTRDRGQTWQEISGDLTRNEIDKQAAGGSPITAEGAGGEIYNTIQYVAESPHAAGTIWVGTDDGLVHLTRDGGEHWTDVTPDGIGEAMINAIEVSPHDAATVYLAVTRYKWGDFTPLVLQTHDYGTTWRRTVEGLPAGSFVRVVREDRRRRGLLYAGTETGVFVSFDDGAHWQSLQQNLPVVPVTDLTVHDDDLVAATQGRAFWILDDLTPLQQTTAAVAQADWHLFEARAAVRYDGGGWRKPPAGRGQNPPPGVLIHYAIGAALDLDGGALRLEVRDAADRLLREWSSADAAEGDDDGDGERGPPAKKPLSVEPGLHRVVWDLRTENIARIDGQFTFGSRQGYRVAPGVYRLRMTCAGRQAEVEVSVLEDPRLQRSRSDYAEQQELAAALWTAANAAHTSVARVRAVRAQIEALLERNAAANADDAVATAGRTLIDGLNAWEDAVVQTRQETFQDVINFPNKLNAELIDLLAKIDGAGPPLTEGARQRGGDLTAAWAARESQLATLLQRDVAAFNELLRANSVPTIDVAGPAHK